jgi:hypothetical protein
MADESIKKRKRANIRQELHKVTLAPTTGKGNAAAKGHKVQTGKRAKIWDSEVRTALQPQLKKDATQKALTPHSPLVEDFRHVCVSKLRAKLQALCARTNNVVPLMAWERWQSSSKLEEQLACSKKKGATLADFILPEDAKRVDQGLVDDLVRASMEPEEARKVVVELTQASAQLVLEISALKKRTHQSGAREKSKGKGKLGGKGGGSGQRDATVVIVQHKHTFDVSLGKKSKRLLKLNTQHYAKLRELFARHTVQGTADNEGAGAAATAKTPLESDSKAPVEIDEKTFQICLFNMLSRYNALLGHGELVPSATVGPNVYNY